MKLQLPRDRSIRHFTQRQLVALKPRPRKQFVVWDATLPGFGVRVNPHGTKTFIVKYRLHSGRVRWKTIGRFGAMPLEKARRKAKTNIGIVADGGDPLHQKDGARGAPTFGDVADRFLDEHVEVRRKPATLRLYRLAIEGHLRPRLGTVPIADVSAADLLRLHQRLRGTPYMANRVLAVASKLMNWAAQHGYRDPHTNPCEGLEKFQEAPRTRYLTPAELTRLGAALRVGQRYGAISPSAIAAKPSRPPISTTPSVEARIARTKSREFSTIEVTFGGPPAMMWARRSESRPPEGLMAGLPDRRIRGSLEDAQDGSRACCST